MEKRHCSYCDGVIAGRTDKKFCNDACRNAFHNERIASYLKQVRPILHILQHNRKILREVLFSGTEVTKQNLLEKGYKMGYCTEHIQAGGQDHHFCFDMGFKEVEAKIIVLERSELQQVQRPLPDVTRQLLQSKDNDSEQGIRKKL